MTRPSPVKRFTLTPDYSISRIIKGGWHLAGGHGTIDTDQAIEDMRDFVRQGITTFDCADIYTGVEELIGLFLKRYREDIRNGEFPEVQIHTKYVPDYDALPTLTFADTHRIIDRSLQRLGVEVLDLVQFAWWDFSIPGHVEAAFHLDRLREEGKIKHIGVTNYDSKHLAELVDAGITPMSNQVQYSILDRRPEHSLVPLCQKHNIALLCYGVLGGGFYGNTYLGAAEPVAPLENRSLTKYHLIIDEFGGWDSFQHALTTLASIGKSHHASISEVAMRYILQKDMVAGVIVGVRHGRHLQSLLRLENFHLDEDEVAMIDLLADPRSFQRALVYEHERQKTGRHGRIMKYNLNDQRE